MITRKDFLKFGTAFLGILTGSATASDPKKNQSFDAWVNSQALALKNRAPFWKEEEFVIDGVQGTRFFWPEDRLILFTRPPTVIAYLADRGVPCQVCEGEAILMPRYKWTNEDFARQIEILSKSVSSRGHIHHIIDSNGEQFLFAAEVKLQPEDPTRKKSSPRNPTAF